MKEALAEFGDLNIGGRVINKVRLTDNKAIVAKTQGELQDTAIRLVNTGRKCDIEITIDKSQVMRVSRSNQSLRIVGNREHIRFMKQAGFLNLQENSPKNVR